MSRKYYKSLPKSVKIGQREYRIIVSSEDVDGALSDAHAYTMKSFDTIVINDNLSAGMLRSTLLHEIMHAIYIVNNNSEAQVPNRNDEEDYEGYSDRWEHFFIEMFSESLVGILRDNPDLVAFLSLNA